jgi:hypothetical protein
MSEHTRPFPPRPLLGSLHVLRDATGRGMILARFDSLGWTVFEATGTYKASDEVAAAGYGYLEEIHLARRTIT